MKITSEKYKITLDILTPIVINNGESYELFELYPYGDGISGTSFGWVLNVPKMLGNMKPAKVEELNRLSCRAVANHDKDAEKEVRNLFQEAVKESGMKELGRRPCTFLPNAKERLRSNPFLEVQRHTTKPMTEKPYIPGSSLKGALRTAILESERKKGQATPFRNQKAKDFEAQLMDLSGNKFFVQQDPFKYLKVSDFEIQGNSRTVVGLVKAGGKVPVYTAMTDAGCLKGFGTSVVAEGTITIDCRAPQFLRMPAIKEAVKAFYALNMNRKLSHCDEFVNPQKSEFLQREQVLENEGWVLLRLGHYSGIENMSFNVDNPWDRRNPEINCEGGNHFSMIENGYPAGFCMMKEEKISCDC